MTDINLVAGVGCSSSVSAAEILGLIESTLARTNGNLVALGTIRRRGDHPALRSAASALGLPLRVFDLPGSEVAEPVAASAGALMVGKQKSARATCALAVVPAGFDLSNWGQASAATAASTLATSVAGP